VIPDIYDVALWAVSDPDPTAAYRRALTWAREWMRHTRGRPLLDLRVLVVRLEGAVAAESVRTTLEVV
jgi:hypothetical protein